MEVLTNKKEEMESKIECNFCDKGCVGAFECWDCNGTGFITVKDGE